MAKGEKVTRFTRAKVNKARLLIVELSAELDAAEAAGDGARVDVLDHLLKEAIDKFDDARIEDEKLRRGRKDSR